MGRKEKGGARLDNPRKGRWLRRLVVVLVSILGLGIVGLALWKTIVKPPEVPKIGDGDDGVAFHSPDFHPGDASLSITDIAPKGVTDADRKQDYYTLLIIGVDSGVNTDTIIVASYDGANREANLISIPRDTLVNVKRNVKKINAAYPAGTLNGGGRDGGIAQLKREIKTIIGFIPDFTVLIDMKAFVRIIDAVGGVEIEVPYAMRYNDPAQSLSINISKGLQTLNGTDALKFARYRRGASGYKTISDYERIQNQQAVISAMLDKLLKPASLLKIPEFIGIFSENVHTDISAGNLLWFAEQLGKLRGADALHTHTLPMSGSSGSPGWYEYIDREATVELVNRTVNPYNVPIKPEDVDIINKAP